MHEKRNTTILLLLYLLLEILVVFLTKQRYKSNKLLRNLDHLCFVPFRIAPINVSSAESSCQKIRWGIVAKAEPHWQFRMHDHSWGRVWPIDVRIFYLFKAHIPDEDMKMTLNEVQYDFNAQGEIFVAKLASPRSPLWVIWERRLVFWV